MKVGVIGSGQVGQVLAKAFKSEGYDVMLGTRNTSKENLVQFNNETKIDVGTFDETAKFGNIIVLATKGTAAEEALRLAGKEDLENKIIIDATNPLADTPPTNGMLHLTTSPEDSLMEQLQRFIPAAKFVKAFNIVGNALMYKPKLQGGPPTMFICGNDDEAKKTVTGILEQFGWETEDLGKAEAARAIEPLSILWCIPGFLHNSWMHAFKLLRP